MTWWACVDSTMVYKRQYINATLSNQLLDYMENKYPEFILDSDKSTYQEKIFFEMGGFGAYIGSQPKLVIDIFDSKLSVDCADVPEWIETLIQTKRRTFSDGTKYIKIYSRMCCLILSLQEKESLLFQLRGKQKFADEETKKFHAGMKAAYDFMESGSFSSIFPTIDIKDIKFFPDKDDKPKE